MPRDVTRVPELLQPAGEAAYYRSLTPEQHAELLAAACRAAADLLRSRPDAERAAAYVDPLPASSIALLARLRAEAKRRKSGSEPT